jgi:ankyrin repeat protein
LSDSNRRHKFDISSLIVQIHIPFQPIRQSLGRINTPESLSSTNRGFTKIVERLFKKGADVNAQGGEYGNALQVASANGHEQIVERLLEKGPISTRSVTVCLVKACARDLHVTSEDTASGETPSTGCGKEAENNVKGGRFLPPSHRYAVKGG